MFGKLKEKLKGAISFFSKRTEEVGEVKEIVVEKKESKILEEKKGEWQNVKTVDKGKKIDSVIQKGKKNSEEKKYRPSPSIKTKEKKKEVQKIESKTKVEKGVVPGDEVQITYFVHGTTTDNEKDLATGWNQGELSKKGIKQSKDLGERLKDKKWEIVFCSDLKRAVDSAHLIFGQRVPIIEDQRLRECNYGSWNGKEAKLFKSKLNEYIHIPFSSGESYKKVEKRIADFLNYLYDQYRGKHVAIVAHQAPQLAMDVLLAGKTWEEAISQDWRHEKNWQPGWDYVIKNKIDMSSPRELLLPQKQSFFGKVKAVFKKGESVTSVPTKEVAVLQEKKVVQPEVVEESNFLGKIKEKLTTKVISAEKFDELFWELEMALLENNVSVEVIEKIKDDLRQELVDKPLPRNVEGKIAETLKKTLEEVLGFPPLDLVQQIRLKNKKPYVVAFFGINGAGKTTSIAKLTYFLQQQNVSVVLAACDTFRAAAIQQLEEHAQRLNVKMIKHDYGADAAAVAFDAIKYAEKNKVDVVLIDTAGRLHSNANLMAELEKIIRVTKPDLKLFVGESITGNDCVEQARRFNALVEMDGVILTKADVDEKGGAPLSIAYTIKKPILFLGMGQEYKDLEKFNAELMLGRLGL